ncbi:pilus assembly protein PilM, partial [Clostridium baratii]
MISFGRDNSIVLEIKDDFVDILVGNSRNILFSDSIPIPEGLCDGGLILDVSRLSEILLKYFLENDIDEKKLSFVAFGSDIVVRCIEIPSMNDEALREAMEFEIKEIIPNEEEYYIDYEIVSKNKENKKNVKLNVIVVACMKKKIDSYVELSKSLGKKLDVIDVLTNTINKVLLKSNLQYKNKAVAIFYLGYTFSNISISYDGVMNIE